MHMNQIQISINTLFRDETQTDNNACYITTQCCSPLLDTREKRKGRERGNNTIKEEIKLSLYTNNNLPSKPGVLCNNTRI